MGFLLEKHQRECLTTLKTLPSVHAAQIGECEVQIQSTNSTGFFMKQGDIFMMTMEYQT